MNLDKEELNLENLFLNGRLDSWLLLCSLVPLSAQRPFKIEKRVVRVSGKPKAQEVMLFNVLFHGYLTEGEWRWLGRQAWLSIMQARGLVKRNSWYTHKDWRH
jgi:hypothetical protein